jgi:pyruvate/2-oxoglutarate dehydrogenase complex dihydrolipoamide dehydrogenase (E3) component
MTIRVDAAVLGGGPGGEVAVTSLLNGGRSVALIERELIGGECSNWACVPTKTLLRVTETVHEAEKAAGVSTPRVDPAALFAYRDYMVANLDDTNRQKRYRERGVEVVKDSGRLDGLGRVALADGGVVEADAVIVATGSDPVIPPIDGLAEAGYWTNREATSLTAVPASAVVVGGGPVGIELAQFLARMGTRVSVVQGADRLLNREAPQLCGVLTQALERDGIEVVLEARAESARREGGERVVRLADGRELRGEVVVIATGRAPRTGGLGLETVGAETGRRGGVVVDERMRAAEGVWAIGDCTGIMQFTHVAKYQARIAAGDILGESVSADYRAVPRVIFTDPEVAAVGLSVDDARAQGIDAVEATIDLPTAIARPYTYEQDPEGVFGVVADRKAGTLVGAWAVSPLAGEWIHQGVLAIRAQVPLTVLRDTMAQFPSYSEAFGSAIRALPATA